LADTRLRPEIVPALVEKVLGNTRAGTKRKGMDLCAMFVEVENGGEGVVVS
jgi:cytoskeleton-associated protein 5